MSWLAVVAALYLCLASAGAAERSPWFEDGRPGAQARQAVELLAAAADQGLDPRDYAAQDLQLAVARAAQGAAPGSVAAHRLELALGEATRRYLEDLHLGRVDEGPAPRSAIDARRRAFDAGAYLEAALQAHRLAEAAREAAPQLPLYEQLREQLARCRALVGDPAWAQALPPLPAARRGHGGRVAPGEPYAGLEMLARRLVAWGDLAPGPSDDAPRAPPTAPLYTGPIVDAVRTFQQRHGLGGDGVIGSATYAQLQVPPAARVRQIELMLERLRRVPAMEGPRLIVVNLPEFMLRAYEIDAGRVVVREEMKVIVGKALDTRTPLFDAEMRYIEFSPYWNVPRSIVRRELLPRLRRDPAYFDREGFEFVAPDGRALASISRVRLDELDAGRLRLRQRPGPRNALGDVKFVFPNRDSIYLHHTPATALFARDRRDFSHGCIRVERPVALARFVLRDMPEWTPGRIEQAMAAGRSTTVPLARPVPVLLAYGTALVKGGRIQFYADVYGLDRRLDAALREHAASRPRLEFRS
ncbi:MAG: L,D-transpeptidase family protein [Burkholderiales bacterium]|nr:L,D-transpeptidase family protein [Burkholderiales bacterium]